MSKKSLRAMLATADDEQMRWLLSKIEPSPPIIVLAYVGLVHKRWVCAGLFSRKDLEFQGLEGIEKIVLQEWPSATVLKIVTVKEGGGAQIVPQSGFQILDEKGTQVGTL